MYFPLPPREGATDMTRLARTDPGVPGRRYPWPELLQPSSADPVQQERRRKAAAEAQKDADCLSAVASTRDHIAATQLNFEQSLKFIVDQARRVTGAGAAAIALRQGEEVVCCARSGAMAPELGVRLDPQSGISGACLRSGEIQQCDDARADPRVDMRVCQELGMRSFLAVPLRRQHEVLGILAVFSGWTGVFSPRHVRTLELLAELVSEPLESKPTPQPAPRMEVRPAQAATVGAAVSAAGAEPHPLWRALRILAMALVILATVTEVMVWHGAHLRKLFRLGNAGLRPTPTTPASSAPESARAPSEAPPEAVVETAPKVASSPSPSRRARARKSAPADLNPLALRTDPSAWTTLQLEPGKPPLALGNLAQKSAWAAWLRGARDLLLGWTDVLPRSRETAARMSAPRLTTSGAPWALPGLTLPVCNGPFVEAGDQVPAGADPASPLPPDDDTDPPPTRATAQRFSVQDPWTALTHPCSSPGAMPLAAPGGNAPGATISVTGLRAPKDARKAYEKAQHALQKRKLAEAQAELEQAVHLYPQYAAAWTDLGWLYAQQNRLEPARHAFAQARSADQNFVPAYLGLAAVAMRESKWPEVVELSARATRLDGADFPAAFYFHSLGNFQLGKLDNAEGSARKAEGLDPHHAWPQVSLLLGVILAQKQDYSGAAEEFKSYLKSAPKAANADKVRHQLAELEKLAALESKAAAAPPPK